MLENDVKRMRGTNQSTQINNVIHFRTELMIRLYYMYLCMYLLMFSEHVTYKNNNLIVISIRNYSQYTISNSYNVH